MTEEQKEQASKPDESGQPESERMRILRMVQEGKITPEEGAKLLESLGPGAEASAGGPGPKGRKWVRIQIADHRGDQVNLRLPGDLPEGDLPVVVRVGAFSSPPGGYITVSR